MAHWNGNQLHNEARGMSRNTCLKKMTVSNNIIRVSKYGMLWNSSRKNPMKHKDSHMLNYKSAIPIDSDRTLDALNSISCDLRIDIIVNYDYLYLIIF